MMEAVAVGQMVVVGAWLGGAEAAAAGTAGIMVAGLGWSVVVGRRALAGLRLVAAAAEVEMAEGWQEDLRRILEDEAAAAEAAARARLAAEQELLRRLWELEDAVEWMAVQAAAEAEEEERRRRWSFERTAVGGG